jgi:brefeldin A-resistance guanine nucleotide exchange factor 1
MAEPAGKDTAAETKAVFEPSTDATFKVVRSRGDKSGMRKSNQLRNGALSTPMSPIAVAVDPIALVTTECVTVTSAMRKHARWAHSSVSAILGGSGSSRSSLDNSRPSTPRANSAVSRLSAGRDAPLGNRVSLTDSTNRWGLRGKKGKSLQDNPLMSAFARLRRDLTQCKGMLSMR